MLQELLDTDKIVDEVIDFIYANTHYLVQRNELERIIRLHILYGTCTILHDKNKIIAICRWNIEDSGRKAKVLDLIIDKNYYDKGIVRQVFLKGISMFPNVKLIGWDRRRKYPTRDTHWYSVRQLLRR